MINVDAEGDLAEVLINQYPDTLFIVDNQNGVHPNTVFGIIGEATRYPIGTMRNDIRLANGKIVYAQPYEILINVGVQGRENSNAAALSMEIRFLLNTPVLKRALRQKGYSVRVDDGDTKRIPMPKNTDMFLRHTFSVWLACDVYTEISSLPLEKVDITEKFEDLNGHPIEEINQIIGED